MSCKSLFELRAALVDCRGDMRTGEAVLLPALAANPARAQFLFYGNSTREGTTVWLPPHELASLDPYSAALIERRPVTPEDLGVRTHHANTPIPFPREVVAPNVFFDSLSVFEELQLSVWDGFLSRRVGTDNEVRDAARLAAAWRALVRSDQQPYFEALSMPYEMWLEQQQAKALTLGAPPT
jgi:hypothetical protein